MAAPLAAALPGFSAALDRCIACFAPDVAAEVAEAVLDPSFPEARLATTELAQPALFSVGTAAAVALRDLGIRPVAVIGHSLGELIAATIAGVLPLRDACRVVTARARAMQACPPGAMAALWCNEEQAQALIAPYRGRIEVAAVNGPSMSVVSGAVADVERLLTELPDALPGRRLPADRAFHSWMVEPARVAIEKAVATAHLAPAEVALALTGSGRLVPAGDEVAPDALIDQARLPVQFDRALAAIVEVRPDAVGLEVGPGRTLSALASARMLWVEPLLRDGARSGGDEVLAALGALWVRGVPVDPSAVIRSGRRVHLPTYPFGGRRIVAPEAVGPPPTRTGRAHEAELPPARDEIVAAAVVAGNDAAADSLTLLSALWAELLGADSVDREADFIDLGGDSLLMTELGNRITRRFGVTVPLRDLMLARTLDAHAKVVQRYVIASAGSEGEASASSDHRPKPDDD
jgi:acyl transferase domain-containing protein